jgi:hypothetical protein
MNDFYSLVYKALIFVSIILFIISFGTSGNTTIGALITGYSCLIVSILMILVMLTNNIVVITKGKETTEIVKSVLFTGGPFLLMLAIISLLLYLIIKYKNLISDGHVSDTYYTFSNISIILFILQLYLIYTNMDSQEFKQTQKLSKIISSLIYLLGVFTSISSLIVFATLTHFTTDG